jgi:glycosyltransferase involved in cell wall biosynthesis
VTLRPLRVLRVISRMNVGGPALQVATLCDELPRERFVQRVLVGGVGDGEGDFRSLRASHLDTVTVRGLGRAPHPTDDARALRALLAEMRRFRPDVVHTHTAKAGLLGRLAAIRTGVPAVVHTFHGHLLRGYFRAPLSRVVTGTERWLSRRTDTLVAVGARVRDELLAAGVGRTEQYRLIPPGVTVGAVPTREAARAELGIPRDARVIAYVGRVTRVKRPDRLAEVVARLPGVHLLVAGDGDLAGSLRDATRAERARTHLLGWRPDVETVCAAADVVVLTSDNEGTPVSLVEAALCGRPVVASGVGSVEDVVVHGETGLVVAPDGAAIARAVERLLDDPALAGRMGEQGARHARRRFSRAAFVDAHVALYDALGA